MAHISNAGHSGIPTHYDAEPAAPAQRHAGPAVRGKEPGWLAKKIMDVIGNGASSIKRRAIGAMDYYNSVHGSHVDESDLHASHARLHGMLEDLQHDVQQLLASFAQYAESGPAPHGAAAGRPDPRPEPEAHARPATAAARQSTRHHANFQRMAQMGAEHGAETQGAGGPAPHPHDATEPVVDLVRPNRAHHRLSGTDSDTVSIMSDDGRDDDDLDSDNGQRRGGRVPPLLPDRLAGPGSQSHEARQRDDIGNRSAGTFAEMLTGNLKVFAEMNRSSINDTLHLIK